MDEASDLPDLDAVLAPAPHYRIKPQAAKVLLAALAHVIKTWEERARQAGLPRSEIAAVAGSFELSDGA